MRRSSPLAAVDARLVLGAEAAFDTPTVQDGHQVAFGRIRVRLDDAVPGATYQIVHPYGVVRATADDRGKLFYTDDNGCMNGPCGFEKLLTQPVGARSCGGTATRHLRAMWRPNTPSRTP